MQRHACGIFLVRGGMCGDKDGMGTIIGGDVAEELGRFAGSADGRWVITGDSVGKARRRLGDNVLDTLHAQTFNVSRAPEAQIWLLCETKCNWTVGRAQVVSFLRWIGRSAGAARECSKRERVVREREVLLTIKK